MIHIKRNPGSIAT